MKRLAILLFTTIITSAEGKTTAGATAKLTFNRDVAPILFENCVSCHRSGGAGSFPLLSFSEAKKRAQLIVRAITSHYMPPWLPEAGHGSFQQEHRLTDAQLATIAAWVKGGALEGEKKDLPSLPAPNGEWQLGTPDLIVTLPKPYSLAADGKDVYRNFVIPKITAEGRYVRAVELQPGTTSAIHHAFIRVDTTGDARRLESQEATPGFPGMQAGRGAQNPGGFLSWQPGRRVSEVPEGMSWLLRKDSDLILQLHLRSTGRPEAVQPQVGLYFTAQPPTRPNMILLLRSASIDIPARQAEYTVESSYKLPVEVDVVGLLPHMHYLGREIRGWAELPDGTTQDLLLIKRWDFNWQTDYRFAEPVLLPRGTTVHMRATYDNSSQNPRNPHHPPERVQYGPQSSDEMGELWFWVETHTVEDLLKLQREYFSTWALQDKVSINEALLRRDPKDAESRTELAVAQSYMGKTDEAVSNLEKAVTDNPQLSRAQFALGTLLTKMQRLIEAEKALQAAVHLDPRNPNAESNLGTVFLMQGKKVEAVPHFEKALALNPADAMAREGLNQARTNTSR